MFATLSDYRCRLAAVVALSIATWQRVDAEPPVSQVVAPPLQIDDAPDLADRRPTLVELSRLADEINPSLAEARAAIESSMGQAIQAGLWPNPTINQASPQSGGSTSQFNGFVTQEIVTMRKKGRDRSAALVAVQQAELEYVTTRFSVLTNVRQEFYSALVAQARVETMANLTAIATQSRDASAKREQGGEGTKADILLLTIELERAQVGLKNAEALLLAAMQRLSAAVGNPRLEFLAVDGDLIYSFADMGFEALRDTMSSRNSQILAAELGIDRSEILLGRAIVQPIPNVFLMGGYQYNAGPTPNNYGIYQVSMSVPVFDRNQGKIRSARADVEKSVRSLGRVKNELSNQLADSLGRYRAARQLVLRYEQQILPTATQTQEMAQHAYERGEFDFLRLLQAQKTLVETRLAYIAAQENRWMAAAEIAGLLQSPAFPVNNLTGADSEIGPADDANQK